MYLKQSMQKNGRIHLSIAKGHYDKQTKRSKTVNVKTLGYLDILSKEYEDPIAFFKAEVEKLNEIQTQENEPISFLLNSNEQLPIGTNNRKNFGYAAFSKIYHDIGINEFIDNRRRYTKAEYNHNNIFKLLTFSRLLYPASKKKTFDWKNIFFEGSDFSLDDIYRSLSFFKKYKNDLMLWIHEHITASYGRDTSLVYYDLTNYYFEIDNQDEMRKRGVSKEHRPNPIVQMGLFLDTNGLPIYYGLFPGNTHDSQTLAPMIDRVQDHYSLGRIIVVADKGIISGDNIANTIIDGNGYVFSFSIRKATDEFKEYVLDEKGYEEQDEQSNFKIKSRIYPRQIYITNPFTGKRENTVVDEKHVIFYSHKYAQKAKADRAEAIEKAKEYIETPSKYNQAMNYGAKKYIKNLKVDKDTNKITENAQFLLSFDEERLKEEEKYDGYYAIVTSEIDKPESEVVDIYRGLWKIEETFKVTKSDFEARPVYLSRHDHIDAHFLICFVALVLERLLEHKLQNKYSTSAILNSLRHCTCSYFQENYYIFDYFDNILNDIGGITSIDFSKKYLRLGEIKKILGNTKKDKITQ